MFEPDNVLPDRALRESPPFDVQGFLERIHSPLAETTARDAEGRSAPVSEVEDSQVPPGWEDWDPA